MYDKFSVSIIYLIQIATFSSTCRSVGKKRFFTHIAMVFFNAISFRAFDTTSLSIGIALNSMSTLTAIYVSRERSADRNRGNQGAVQQYPTEISLTEHGRPLCFHTTISGCLHSVLGQILALFST